jgi:hypothetical protein
MASPLQVNMLFIVAARLRIPWFGGTMVGFASAIEATDTNKRKLWTTDRRIEMAPAFPFQQLHIAAASKRRQFWV